MGILVDSNDTTVISVESALKKETIIIRKYF